MNKRQQKMRDDIRSQSDREIAENMLYFQAENEKHLNNISNVANLIFWVTIVGIIVGVIAAVA